MKIAFWGTPQFAVPALRHLLADPSFDLVCVYTNPDKPAGRGRKSQAGPVKECALEAGLVVLQPETLKSAEVLEQFRDLDPDIAVVVSYGALIPDELLAVPRWGFINIHPSLLPKYRGATPMRAALMAGDPETGVTIMKVTSQLDSGDILKQTKLAITPADDYGTLSDVLSLQGALDLCEVLHVIENSQHCEGLAQDETAASLCGKIRAQDCHLAWDQSADKIVCCIRSLSPVPAAFSLVNGETLKIFCAERVAAEALPEVSAKPGTIVQIVKNKGLLVAAGEGYVLLTDLQPAGGKRMSGGSFVCGKGRSWLGSVLS